MEAGIFTPGLFKLDPVGIEGVDACLCGFEFALKALGPGLCLFYPCGEIILLDAVEAGIFTPGLFKLDPVGIEGVDACLCGFSVDRRRLLGLIKALG